MLVLYGLAHADLLVLHLCMANLKEQWSRLVFAAVTQSSVMSYKHDLGQCNLQKLAAVLDDLRFKCLAGSLTSLAIINKSKAVVGLVLHLEAYITGLHSSLDAVQARRTPSELPVSPQGGPYLSRQAFGS